MRKELQNNLFEAGTVLYGACSRVSGRNSKAWKFECPDDCFDILLDLTIKLEDYNRRFPNRRIRAVSVKMEDGKLNFQVQRASAGIQRIITSSCAAMTRHRSGLKKTMISRAKKIQCTALFESKLLPDWKRLMPDDKDTCRKILQIAEKTARLPVEWERIAGWYKSYLRDNLEYTRCLEHLKK